MSQYDFRKEIVVNHYKIDVKDEKACSNELAFPALIKINVNNLDIVGKTAVEDFKDFLNETFNIKSERVNKKAFINFYVDEKLDKTLINYRIEIDNEINIYGSSDRSLAQSLYYLEFCLKERKFYAVKKGVENKKMPYSPRMVHSGYGLDMYPDEHLASIAHAGMDAIVVFVKDVNLTPSGFMDFNELIYRASKYGIDVYAYMQIKNKMNI